MGHLRSQKQEREQLVASLRESGECWIGVAAVLQQRYRVNARVALRYAHGWSQRDAANAWNERWPDELKTFKTFSYWELAEQNRTRPLLRQPHQAGRAVRMCRQ